MRCGVNRNQGTPIHLQSMSVPFLPVLPFRPVFVPFLPVPFRPPTGSNLRFRAFRAAWTVQTGTAETTYSQGIAKC
jgi:hypothetical protein